MGENLAIAATARKPRYLVGIDLGTTHTVVAYADIGETVEAAEPRMLEIEQLAKELEALRNRQGPVPPEFEPLVRITVDRDSPPDLPE